jgi:two-component system, LytTR family, response regulator
MIKAVLVDDEKLSRNTLRKLLDMYCPDVEIIAECDNADDARKQVDELKPSLVFLDVAMPGKNGIDFLKELPQIDFEVIFVTAHDKYVLQAIRYAAVDYLSKPVEEQQLVTAVASAAKRIHTKSLSHHLETFLHNIRNKSNQAEMQLCIPSIKGFQIVRINDIIYCEADNTYTWLYLQNNQRLMASRPLIDYELLLQDANFVRIHKSYLINLNHLREYHKGEGGTVKMSNGKELDVSRRKKEFFVSYMKDHFKY